MDAPRYTSPVTAEVWVRDCRHRRSGHFALSRSLTAAAVGFCLLLTHLRADDTIRRVQEELRKRNLYFGDIDGQNSRGILGALRRYQERKGFPATGQPDEITLRSLNINPLDGHPKTSDDPWPETPILKSDQARRPPPLGASVLANPSPSPLAGGEGAVIPAAPAIASVGPSFEPDRATPPMDELHAAVPSSPPPGGAAVLTPEAARTFLENYLRAGSSNDLNVEMSFYGDSVDYFDKGPANRDYIARDVRRYYRRWPSRRFELLGPVTVLPGPGKSQSTVRFLLKFVYHGNVRGRDRQVEGRTDNAFILAGGNHDGGEDLRIVGMKEQRVRP